MPTPCGKLQFALVDAIETKCLDGISEEAFKQKISEKLGDANLSHLQGPRNVQALWE